jgi:hypothetical protein
MVFGTRLRILGLLDAYLRNLPPVDVRAQKLIMSVGWKNVCANLHSCLAGNSVVVENQDTITKFIGSLSLGKLLIIFYARSHKIRHLW